MKRLLFVDDEPRIRQALERMLFPLAAEWEMTFLGSGAEAIEAMQANAFDVLVTDMRMPGMDGAALLRWARDHKPDVVRIVLSGYAEEAAALRALPVAHQFLNKPCSAKHLRDVVERACHLRELIEEEGLRQAIGGLESLPPRPETERQLTELMAKPGTSMNDLAEVLGRDQGLVAKVLQIVNSAFFGLPRSVSRVDRALAFLGMNMLRNVVLAVETFGSFPKPQGISPEREQQHALDVAMLAHTIAAGQDRDMAFMAGLLHDIGKLVLAITMPDEQVAISNARRRAPERSSLEIEAEVGSSHQRAGAYLLGIWGLPYPIVEAAALHHEPMRAAPRSLDILGVVAVANAIVHDKITDEVSALLEHTRTRDRLDEWREQWDATQQKNAS